MTYRIAKQDAKMFFSMMLDTDKIKIPGLNRGRLVLLDSLGVIGRWVFTSSFDSKQSVYDWNVTGGVIPPNYEMNGDKPWEFHTERIIRNGHIVNDGFLVTYNGMTSYKTKMGVVRSEIMVHNDENRIRSPGSYGCIVASSDKEWEDFCKAVKESLKNMDVIPLFVVYTF